MWDLWWANGQRDSFFFSEYFFLRLSKSIHHCSMLIFFHILLLPEEQWEPSKMQCICRKRGALHTKIFSLFFLFQVLRIFYSMGPNKILWRVIHTYTHGLLEPRYKSLLVQDESISLQCDGRCPNPIADPLTVRSQWGKYPLPVFKCFCSWPYRTLNVIFSVDPPIQTHWRIFDPLLAGTWLPH